MDAQFPPPIAYCRHLPIGVILASSFGATAIPAQAEIIVSVVPRWEERNGRWAFQSRRWDRDGDGVPNSRDSHPNNPNCS